MAEKYEDSIYYVCTGHDVTSSHLDQVKKLLTEDSSHDS